MCLRDSQEASVTVTERAKGQWEGMRSKKWPETGSYRALLATTEPLDFILSEISSHCRVFSRDIRDNICPIGRVFVRNR